MSAEAADLGFALDRLGAVRADLAGLRCARPRPIVEPRFGWKPSAQQLMEFQRELVDR
jgi:hypothetical protein